MLTGNGSGQSMPPFIKKVHGRYILECVRKRMKDLCAFVTILMEKERERERERERVIGSELILRVVDVVQTNSLLLFIQLSLKFVET